MTTVRSHDGAVYALAADDTWLASAGEDGDVVLTHLESGDEQLLLRSARDDWDHAHRLQWHGGVLHWASLSGRAGELMPGGETADLRAGSSRWGEAVEETLCDLAVGSDGTVVVAGGDVEGRVVLERPSGEQLTGTTYRWPYSVAISPSGSSVLVATWDGRVHVSSTQDLSTLGEQELAVGSLSACFDGLWLNESTVVIVGAGRGSADAVWVATVHGEVLWSALPGEQVLCVERFGEGFAVGCRSGAVFVFAPSGDRTHHIHALEDAPGAPAPFPSNAEYFEVPPQAVCSLAAHNSALFVGLAGGVVRRVR